MTTLLLKDVENPPSETILIHISADKELYFFINSTAYIIFRKSWESWSKFVCVTSQTISSLNSWVYGVGYSQLDLLLSPCIMCVQYIGRCSVHRGVFSTSEGYHEYIGGVQYIGGYSVHWRNTMSTSGDIMIHVGGYHKYIGGIS